MNKLTPKVSVIMSVYNSSCYLQESIESILNQTFTDFEFIIIDDGSRDNTWEILTKYAKQDQRIKLFSNQENIGLIESLNKGLKLATGEYIARQDADDISMPKRLKNQIMVLNAEPEVVLVSGNLELINSAGQTIDRFKRACDSKLVPWYMLFYNRVAGHSQVMYRKKSVVNLGGYSQGSHHAEDYELWCRLIKVGKIVIMPQILLKYRVHDKSVSAENHQQQLNCSLSVVQNNIQKLINQEISLAEAEYLMKFWLGHWWPQQFPEVRSIDSIKILHSRLKEIYAAFLEQDISQTYSPSQMSDRLRCLIGKQFCCWIQASPSKKNDSLATKLELSRCAFYWNPWEVPLSWLRWFWNVFLDILVSILVRFSLKDTLKRILTKFLPSKRNFLSTK